MISRKTNYKLPSLLSNLCMFFLILRASGEFKYKQKTKTATFKNSVGFTGEGQDSAYAMLTGYHKLESEG